MKQNCCITAALLLGMILSACDDRSTLPQSVIEQAKQASAEKARKTTAPPTTQELLNGPRTRLALIPLPLTMQVPAGWGKMNDNNAAGIKVSAAGLNVIQGYTPSGEVEIRLSSHPTMKQDALDQILAFGKKEMQEKPTQYLKCELRPLGSVKVLERQSLGQPAPLTTYDQNNQPQTKMVTMLNWSMSVLVPAEGGYQNYELSFFWLTKDLYDKDKDFLNSVLSTLHYQADSAPEPTTAPATQP